MLPSFPTHYFRLADQRISLVSRTMSGGVNAAGFQRRSSLLGGGFWMFEFEGGALRTRQQLKAWRALDGQSDGGVTKFIVPICDLRQAPVPTVDGRRFYGTPVPHSDGAPFSDDSLYAGTPGITAELTADATLRATTLFVQMGEGNELEGGEYFSIDHDGTMGRRMYLVTEVVSEVDGLCEIKIRPPLREAVTEGAALDFNSPSCTMQVANPDEVAPMVRSLRFAEGRIVFSEAF